MKPKRRFYGDHKQKDGWISVLVIILWQGIYDLVRHNKKIGTERLSFYHPNLLCCPDQMLAVMELSQHLVSSSKTVRPIIPRGARCMEHAKII